VTPYDLHPNTFYFTVPHQVHLKEGTTIPTSISLSFNDDFVASDNDGSLRALPIIQNPHNGHALSLTPKDVRFVEDMLEKILTEYASKEAWQNSMLLSCMKVLLIYLSRLYVEQFENIPQGEDRILLKKYLAAIESSFTDLHEVAAYAEKLHISPGHLGDVIKAQSGRPAIALIHDRLMLEAKRLLFHTDQSMKEVAFHLGFEDASYFNRFFKRLTGLTPLSYRNHFREMSYANR
jgi:AraC family transcriptional activator of pobA